MLPNLTATAIANKSQTILSSAGNNSRFACKAKAVYCFIAIPASLRILARTIKGHKFAIRQTEGTMQNVDNISHYQETSARAVRSCKEIRISSNKLTV